MYRLVGQFPERLGLQTVTYYFPQKATQNQADGENEVVRVLGLL